MHDVLSTRVKAALLRGVDSTTNTELEMGLSTNICMPCSSKFLFTHRLCLKHYTTAVATCLEKVRARGNFTLADTDFDLTLRSYIPRYGAFAYVGIPEWVTACVIFRGFFFFCPDEFFVSKTKFYFVIYIVFFSHECTTISGSLAEEMRKRRDASFSPSFYFDTEVLQL